MLRKSGPCNCTDIIYWQLHNLSYLIQLSSWSTARNVTAWRHKLGNIYRGHLWDGWPLDSSSHFSTSLLELILLRYTYISAKLCYSSHQSPMMEAETVPEIRILCRIDTYYSRRITEPWDRILIIPFHAAVSLCEWLRRLRAAVHLVSLVANCHGIIVRRRVSYKYVG